MTQQNMCHRGGHIMSMKNIGSVAASPPLTNHLSRLLQCTIKDVQTTQSSDIDLRHYRNNDGSQAT
jgi:hypothetical protein